MQDFCPPDVPERTPTTMRCCTKKPSNKIQTNDEYANASRRAWECFDKLVNSIETR